MEVRSSPKVYSGFVHASHNATPVSATLYVPENGPELSPGMAGLIAEARAADIQVLIETRQYSLDELWSFAEDARLLMVTLIPEPVSYAVGVDDRANRAVVYAGGPNVNANTFSFVKSVLLQRMGTKVELGILPGLITNFTD